ncbi:MAG: hypothetical protein OHK0022_51620 [Roseiflexaceae bacterium]
MELLRERPGSGRQRLHARLSYSTQPDAQIVKGITALGQLLQEQAASGWRMG